MTQAKARKVLTSAAYPNYRFSIPKGILHHLNETLGETDLVPLHVTFRPTNQKTKGEESRSTLLMELTIGEILTLSSGLLCKVVAVDYAYSGRSAEVLAQVIHPSLL